MSSHKASAASESSTSSTKRATSDIALSMLLAEDEGQSAMPLSDGALRSAHLDEEEDDSQSDEVQANGLLDDDAEEDDEGLGVGGFGTSGAADEPSLKPFREDSRVDRRIIEGMLRDRDTFIEEMETEGFTQAAVLRRAAELGLSEALIRQVKGVAADLAGERPGRRPAPSSLGARTCLSCDRVFLSSGPGNRLCMRCRGGDAGLAQL